MFVGVEQSVGGFASGLGLGLGLGHGLTAACVSWQARVADFVIPGGESLVGMRQCVKAALEAIARRGHKQVIVVTHGGVLDCVYRIAGGIDDAAPRDWVLANASINRIEIDGGHWRMGAWGEAAHGRLG